MRCAVMSRAGRVLANDRLLLSKDEANELRLNLETDGGRLLQGGIISADGDLSAASQDLLRQFLGCIPVLSPHPKSLSLGARDFEFWLPSPLGRRVGDEGGSEICKTGMHPFFAVWGMSDVTLTITR